MTQKKFSLLAGMIFSLVTILHGLRVIFGWEAIVGDLLVPIWISYFGFIVAGFLAYQCLKLSRKSQ